MVNRILILIVMMIFTQRVFSEIFPKNNSTLIANTFVLEFNQNEKAAKYKLVIAKDKNYQQWIVDTILTNVFLPLENLNWNQAYYWKVEELDTKNKSLATREYAFQTISDVSVSKNVCKIENLKDKIELKKNKKHVEYPQKKGKLQKIDSIESLLQNLVIGIDGINGYIDIFGNYKWILPDNTYKENITMLRNGNVAYISGIFKEVNIYGETVFQQKPKFQFQNHENINFHHGFKELKNGDIVILGFEKIPDDTIVKYHWDDLEVYKTQKELFASSIIFINKQKGVYRYISLYRNLLTLKHEKDYQPKLNDLLRGGIGHLNGLDFSNDEKTMVLSFRDLNTLMFYDLSKDTILKNFNKKNLFTKLHSPLFVSDTTILFYRNGKGEKGDTISSVSLYDFKNNELLNSYPCTSETKANSFSVQKGDFDVILPNKFYFICMGSVNRCFIINDKNHILWQSKFYTLQEKDSIKNEKLGFSNISKHKYYNDLIVSKKGDSYEIRNLCNSDISVSYSIDNDKTPKSITLKANAVDTIKKDFIKELVIYEKDTDYILKTYSF